MTTAHQARSYPFASERLDLDPLYDRLRREEPLSRVQLPYGAECWLATRYEDVRLVLGDPRFSRANAVGPDLPRMLPEVPVNNGSILAMDPPDHTRLRRLVAKAFTARRVEMLRPRVREIVDDACGAMAAAGPPADLVTALALPLPVTVICEVLGVPYADRDRFRAWSDDLLSTVPGGKQEEARTAMAGYLAGLVERRRADPGDTILDALISARDDEDRLSEFELVVMAMTLLVAGHETTANQIGNFLYVLFGQPGLWEKLCADPELIPTAVEELMRFVPLGAAATFARVATEDVQVGDTLVRAGDAVLAMNAAANRDDTVFDRPEQIDLARAENPHLGFGHGVHHCLGAQLARSELQEALRGLASRFGDLRPAVPVGELEFKRGSLVRGLRALPVTW